MLRVEAVGAVLVLAVGLSGCSMILNMRYVLASFIDEPVPLRFKVGTLHHELLHRSLSGMIPTDSPLLAQYADEHPRVRSHLHLLSLQKAVYLRLGLEAELAELVAVDSMLPGGYYETAWAIINEAPNRYQDFV